MSLSLSTEKFMIRKIKQSDREFIFNMLHRIKEFNNDDVQVAMELVDTALINPQQTDYNFFVYDEDEKVVGYHCTGKRPLTDGVYDLYWIVVDPDKSGRGIGKELLRHSENFVNANNGRWLLIETSSKELYENTRNFYIKNNYELVYSIDDFYKKGESIFVYGKKFLN